jgi:hypothetical protein
VSNQPVGRGPAGAFRERAGHGVACRAEHDEQRPHEAEAGLAFRLDYRHGALVILGMFAFQALVWIAVHQPSRR